MSKSIDNLLKSRDLSGITTYQAGIMQANANRKLQKLSDDILAPYGITKMQWYIIGCALDAGAAGIRITDLAKILATTLSYLTNAVNLLELKGMLVRADNIDDSRSKFVRVQPDFAERCTEIEDTMRRRLRASIYSHVDVEEFHTYIKVTYQLAGADKQNK